MLNAARARDIRELIEDKAPRVLAPIDWQANVGKVPEALIEIWKTVGAASWDDGSYRTIDPSLFKSAVDWALQSTSIRSESAVPYIATAFGTLTTWHPDHGLISIDPVLGRNIVSKSPKVRAKRSSPDIEILSGFLGIDAEQSNFGLYSAAVAKLGHLGENEVFAFVPALAFGGRAQIEFVEKAMADVHLDILSQSVDFQTFFIEGSFGDARLVPFD